MDSYRRILAANKLFAGLNAEQVGYLLDLAEERTYKPGDMLVQEGQPGADMALIIEGEARVLKKEEKSDKYYVITTLAPGAVIGEISLLDTLPRAASVEASTTVKALLLPVKNIHALKNSPDNVKQLIYYKIAEQIAAELCARIRKTNEIVVGLRHSTELEKNTKIAKSNLIADLFSF